VPLRLAVVVLLEADVHEEREEALAPLVGLEHLGGHLVAVIERGA